MTKLTAAFAALTLLTLPAAAGAQTDRETVSVSVPTASAGGDLDVDGMQKIARRIDRAISKACLSGDDDLTARLSPDWQCRREMRHDALAKLAALRQGGGGQVAAAASATAIMR